MTDLVHQVIITNSTFFFFRVKKAVKVGEVPVEIDTVVVGTTNQIVISSLSLIV
jgi:hypothetical protein